MKQNFIGREPNILFSINKNNAVRDASELRASFFKINSILEYPAISNSLRSRWVTFPSRRRKLFKKLSDTVYRCNSRWNVRTGRYMRTYFKINGTFGDEVTSFSRFNRTWQENCNRIDITWTCVKRWDRIVRDCLLNQKLWDCIRR